MTRSWGETSRSSLGARLGPAARAALCSPLSLAVCSSVASTRELQQTSDSSGCSKTRVADDQRGRVCSHPVGAWRHPVPASSRLHSCSSVPIVTYKRKQQQISDVPITTWGDLLSPRLFCGLLHLTPCPFRSSQLRLSLATAVARQSRTCKRKSTENNTVSQ